MTATAVQISQQTGISDKEWVRLFPKDVIENYTSSLTFIKQLSVIAVSTITYLKNAFPEESYGTEMFAGLKLKILKDKCQDELAQFISNSMKQAFEAFDKKYVHMLALCFYSGDCSAENLIEYHVFEYTYTPEGVSMTINSKNRESGRRAMRCSVEDVKERTAMLVRALSLYVWQNCIRHELPVGYDVSLRLYYTEDAPDDYQAPGFGPSTGPDHLAATADQALCLGWVETPYHKIIARAFTRDSEAAPPSDNLLEMKQDCEEIDGRCARSPNSQASADWQASADGQASADSQASADGQASADSQASAAPALRCPCTNTDVVDEILVTCQYCHTQQHAACFGLQGPAAEHCCEACAPLQPGRRASCPLLVGLERRKQESLCIFRRTLMLCSRQSAVSGEQILAQFGLTANSTSKMLRLLQTHSVLPGVDDKDLAMRRKINTRRLKLAFKQFFHEEKQADCMVDRLIAETDQDISDPVGDVLSPLEKVTLHNSSNLGTTWHTVVPTVPDPMLQQYRDVLLKDEVTDQLPLSGDHNPVRDVERIAKKSRRRTAEDDDEDWKPSKLPKLRSGTKTKKKN